MQKIVPYTREEILNFSPIREGEIRLGETIPTDSSSPEVKFVILGIPEDTGPQANGGLPGAHHAWDAFLKAFLTIQDNGLIPISTVALLGKIDCSSIAKEPNDDVFRLREKTDQLDELVYPVIQQLIEQDKIPIVIGGGHNNSYPLLKGASLALNHSVNCINIDPHADLRAMEGRHSGNGFSYAFNEGYLNYYHVLGLHENYNSAFILQQFEEHYNLSYSAFEDYLHGKYTIEQLAERALRKTAAPVALEIDMDAIAYMPSSAATPSGFSLNDMRYLLHILTQQNNPFYLHIAEGAPESPQEQKMTGKAIAYLVSDFIKSY